MFFLNRLVLELLSPFTFSLFAILLGLLCILLKKRRLGLTLQVVGLTVLLTLGYGVVTKDQFIKFENQYAPLNVDLFLKNLKDKYIMLLFWGQVMSLTPDCR